MVGGPPGSGKSDLQKYGELGCKCKSGFKVR